MNGDVILLRQVHPGFVHEGRVSSQAFRPMPKDDFRLSVYNGALISPQGAFEHYTSTLGHESIGVMGISVDECAELDLTASPDPIDFQEHAIIDFTGLSKREIGKKAKLLRTKAEVRGWLHKSS